MKYVWIIILFVAPSAMAFTQQRLEVKLHHSFCWSPQENHISCRDEYEKPLLAELDIKPSSPDDDVPSDKWTVQREKVGIPVRLTIDAIQLRDGRYLLTLSNRHLTECEALGKEEFCPFKPGRTYIFGKIIVKDFKELNDIYFPQNKRYEDEKMGSSYSLNVRVRTL